MLIAEDKVQENAQRIREVYEGGGVILHPTETVYGLGCNPFRQDAVQKIYELKRRPEGKPFLLVALPQVVPRLVWMNAYEFELARNFWPGPLTLVLRSKVRFPPLLEKAGKIAVRISPHRVLNQILAICGGAMVSTSANFSGEPPPKSLDEVPKEIKEKCDIVVEGQCPGGKPSTVVEVQENLVLVHREGAISVLQLKAVASSLGLQVAIVEKK